ncbi:MAG: helix-turn-helix transcriptional regulator [Thermoanaerobaculia bacterium]|jgi:DNA-binding XRE family transcriptional regulator
MRERLNAIKALRLAHNPPLRQVDLAVRIGVERGVISLYENGGREPSIKKAMQIARVFHVSVEHVFYGVFEVVDGEQAVLEVDLDVPRA